MSLDEGGGGEYTELSDEGGNQYAKLSEGDGSMCLARSVFMSMYNQ